MARTSQRATALYWPLCLHIYKCIIFSKLVSLSASVRALAHVCHFHGKSVCFMANVWIRLHRFRLPFDACVRARSLNLSLSFSLHWNSKMVYSAIASRHSIALHFIANTVCRLLKWIYMYNKHICVPFVGEMHASASAFSWIEPNSIEFNRIETNWIALRVRTHNVPLGHTMRT